MKNDTQLHFKSYLGMIKASSPVKPRPAQSLFKRCCGQNTLLKQIPLKSDQSFVQLLHVGSIR